MRLTRVSRNLPWKYRLVFGLLGLIGKRPNDHAHVLLYRERWFGTRADAVHHAALVAPSEWTRWERELMASFVSRLNSCPF